MCHFTRTTCSICGVLLKVERTTPYENPAAYDPADDGSNITGITNARVHVGTTIKRKYLPKRLTTGKGQKDCVAKHGAVDIGCV